MTDQHCIHLLDRSEPKVFTGDPPMIRIEPDGLRVWNGSDYKDKEYYNLYPDEANADVWMNLEMGRP